MHCSRRSPHIHTRNTKLRKDDAWAAKTHLGVLGPALCDLGQNTPQWTFGGFTTLISWLWSAPVCAQNHAVCPFWGVNNTVKSRQTALSGKGRRGPSSSSLVVMATVQQAAAAIE